MDVQPKPDDVEIPEDEEWEDLTAYQRWYYKNQEEEKARVRERKEELLEWLTTVKSNLSCERCGFDDHPHALDFHHPGDKDKSPSRMVNHGYSKEAIREEMERCEVLCANCHRIHHSRD